MVLNNLVGTIFWWGD